MRKKGPWTIKETRSVYKNEWIEVVEDKVIRPDGKDGLFSVIYQKSGVCVIPVAEDGAIYLVKEYHYAVEQETIEGISGGIEANEKETAAAKRELEEEAGIVASTLTPLGMVHPFTSAVYSPTYLFMAQELTFTKQQLEGTEHIEVVCVPFATALQWIQDGKIVHAPTVVLLLKMQSLLS